MTEWVGEQLFCIINHRYNEKLQTIITTNFNAKDIMSRMATVDGSGKVVSDIQGNRIMSRIYGMYQAVELNGNDFRRMGGPR